MHVCTRRKFYGILLVNLYFDCERLIIGKWQILLGGA